MLAFFQATQLNLFERFLTQAVSGINSTNITSGMQQVAYVVLLVGFLWQVYQSALHGGDVRGLGTNLIKYVVTVTGSAMRRGPAISFKTGPTTCKHSSTRLVFRNCGAL